MLPEGEQDALAVLECVCQLATTFLKPDRTDDPKVMGKVVTLSGILLGLKKAASSRRRVLLARKPLGPPNCEFCQIAPLILGCSDGPAFGRNGNCLMFHAIRPQRSCEYCE
jgi:hypothetical protein